MVGTKGPGGAGNAYWSPEDKRLRVAFAFPLRLDAIIAYRLLLAALDAAPSTGYHNWLSISSWISDGTYLSSRSWYVFWQISAEKNPLSWGGFRQGPASASW